MAEHFNVTEIQEGTVTRKSPCSTCPFVNAEYRNFITAERMTEIYSYLLDGLNHFCHSDDSNKTICKGGRQWQLQMWFNIGIISEPTEQALIEEMAKYGIQAASHINS